MNFALSTNWNCDRWDDGAAIADEAEELGFDALELGFKTRPEHLSGIRSRLDSMPVASVHAYCPAPVGCPSGHPELYRICSPDADERALARLTLVKTIRTAAELGAYTWEPGVREGDFTNRPCDRDNHLMDALRYAMEDVPRPPAGNGKVYRYGLPRGGWKG